MLVVQGHAEIDALVYVHRHDARAREWIQLVDLAFDTLIAVLSSGPPGPSEVPTLGESVFRINGTPRSAIRESVGGGLSELQRELLGEVRVGMRWHGHACARTALDSIWLYWLC